MKPITVLGSTVSKSTSSSLVVLKQHHSIVYLPDETNGSLLTPQGTVKDSNFTGNFFGRTLIACLFALINSQNGLIFVGKFITVVVQKVFLHNEPINRYTTFLFFLYFF